MLGLAAPVTGAALGWIVLGQSLSYTQLAGFVITLTAVGYGAATVGNVNPHVNFGYTFGGAGMEFGEDNRWIGSFGDPELIERSPSQELDYTINRIP